MAFISTNYDILIDNALSEQAGSIDYGVDFRGFPRGGLFRSTILLKPHGSLNWLFCPTCNDLKITPNEKGVVNWLMIDFRRAACDECGSVYMPLVVPPTFYKDLKNVFLGQIWNKADNLLRQANHIIFCGYSFPDADMHIKYLLKRSQVNRGGPNQLRFTVINSKKKKELMRDEEHRFKRFLGNNVEYTHRSFEDFVSNPEFFLK